MRTWFCLIDGVSFNSSKKACSTKYVTFFLCWIKIDKIPWLAIALILWKIRAYPIIWCWRNILDAIVFQNDGFTRSRVWGVRGPRAWVQGLPALHGQQLGRQNAEGGRMKLINIVKVKCILNSSLFSYERMFVFPNRFRSRENKWASNLNPVFCSHTELDHVNLVRKHCYWHQRLVRLRPKRQKKLSGFFCL